MTADRRDVIAYRLAAQHLDHRLPPRSRFTAAFRGLQDGAPRSALLALHARAAGVQPDDWEHSSLTQVWGPRGAVFVVPSDDVAVFTLGLLQDPAGAKAAADALAAAFRSDRVRKRDALPAVGGDVRRLLLASTTGRVRIRWDTRDTLVWVTPPRPRTKRRASR